MIPDCISDCCFWISHYGGRLGIGGVGMSTGSREDGNFAWRGVLVCPSACPKFLEEDTAEGRMWTAITWKELWRFGRKSSP